MLFELLAVIQREHTVSLDHLSRFFQSSPSAIEPMLARWEQRGKIKRFQSTVACGTRCGQCETSMSVMYQVL